MLPIIFRFGPVTIYSQGFLLAIGVFLGAFIIWRRLKDLGFSEEKVLDLEIWSGIWGLVIARLFFILGNFPLFGWRPDHWLLFVRYPGFSFWGGLAGIFLYLLRFTRKQKWDFWKTADEVIYGLLPILLLWQMGQFLDGSVLGRVTNMPWGVYFANSLVRQQPVSLFWVVLLFLTWIGLRKIERHWRTWNWYKSKNSGLQTLIFIGSLFLINFLLAFLKRSGVYFFWLELGLSLTGLITSGIFIWQRSKISKR